MVKQKPVKNHAYQPNRPRNNLVLGGKVDGPAGKNGAKELDIAHGIVEKGKEDGIHA